MTTRDRIWTAALDLASQRRFTASDVADHPAVTGTDDADGEDETATDGGNSGASRRTIRDTLHAIADAGHVEHRTGEHYYYPPSEASPHTRLRDRPPRRWTFTDREVREWVEAHLEGRTLNLFAGETLLTHPSGGEIVRNDVDSLRPADHHIDAIRVGDYFAANAFDTVVADPPWGESIVHSRSIYNGNVVDDWTRVRDGIARVLRPGGRFIRLGYDTDGLSTKHATRVEATLSIHFVGRERDAGGVVERLAWPTGSETGDSGDGTEDEK